MLKPEDIKDPPIPTLLPQVEKAVDYYLQKNWDGKKAIIFAHSLARKAAEIEGEGKDWFEDIFEARARVIYRKSLTFRKQYEDIGWRININAATSKWNYWFEFRKA